jgi:glutathione peroxidase
MTFYDLSAKTPQGETINMADFKGKVVLIVNTATKCGFTPQLEGLQKLHEKYAEKGLVVLGFPCNQFGEQEPETNETVESVCKINYGVTFQLTEKVEVNGENAHPVFEFLKNSLSGWFGKKIRWNFTKFLIDSDGVPYKRYGSTTTPEQMEKDILKLVQIEQA